MARNEKRDAKKVSVYQDKENREYQETLRRQFIEFLSSRQFEDAQMKSILNKESAIEKRLHKLKQISEDRLKIVECFRNSLIDASWKSHVETEVFKK